MYSNLTTDFYEIAIVGKAAKIKLKQLNKYYIPNKLIAGSTQPSNAPLLKNRFSEDKTFFYICVEGTCKLPVESVKKATSQIQTAIE